MYEDSIFESSLQVLSGYQNDTRAERVGKFQGQVSFPMYQFKSTDHVNLHSMALTVFVGLPVGRFPRNFPKHLVF